MSHQDGQHKDSTQGSIYGTPQDAYDNLYAPIGNGNNTESLYETIGNDNNTNNEEEHFYEYDNDNKTIDNLYETIHKKDPPPPSLPRRDSAQIDIMIQRENSTEFQKIVTEIGLKGESNGFDKGLLQDVLNNSKQEIESKGSNSPLDKRVQVLEKAIKKINKAEKKLAKKASKIDKLMQKVDKKEQNKKHNNHINQVIKRSWTKLIVRALVSSIKSGAKNSAKNLAQGIKKRLSSIQLPKASSADQGRLRKTKSLGDINLPKANKIMKIRQTKSLSDLSPTDQEQENSFVSLDIPAFKSSDSFGQAGDMGNNDVDESFSKGNFNISTSENEYVVVNSSDQSDQSAEELFSMDLGGPEKENNSTQNEENTGGITLSAGGGGSDC